MSRTQTQVGVWSGQRDQEARLVCLPRPSKESRSSVMRLDGPQSFKKSTQLCPRPARPSEHSLPDLSSMPSSMTRREKRGGEREGRGGRKGVSGLTSRPSVKVVYPSPPTGKEGGQNRGLSLRPAGFFLPPISPFTSTGNVPSLSLGKARQKRRSPTCHCHPRSFPQCSFSNPAASSASYHE